MERLAVSSSQTEIKDTAPENPDFLKGLAHHYLPPEHSEFSASLLAEDLDEPLERIISALDILHMMKVVDYQQDGDTIKLLRKTPNMCTDAAYLRVFPIEGIPSSS